MSAADGLRAELRIRRGPSFRLDLDLAIDAGVTVALLGPNGSGKSTTVDGLAGLVPLDDGSITLAGRVLDEPARARFVSPEDRRIGIVFQSYLLFEHLSVVENVAFGPRCRGRGRRDAHRIARHWIELLDLVDLAARHPRELSGGQAQRVSLARALATEPDLLLLDEPLAALDVTTRSELRRLLRRHLATYPGPRLLITHDPADAFLLADRIHVIEDGRLTQAGSPDEIRHHPATPYVAALAGTNLLTGTNEHGTLTLDDRSHTLQTSDAHTNGPVLITIHPTAVALHQHQPEGSPRNTWPTTVALIEPLGETTRIVLGDPLPITVDITPAAARALALRPGSPAWAAVKATEITVAPM